MAETITIAGREFKPNINSTMEADVFNQGMIARAGLDKLHMTMSESADEFALRVFREMAAGTDIFLLLGGMLLPVELESTDWTPALAEKTATMLRLCTAEADKKIIRSQIIGSIMGFLRAGLISIALFPKSSAGSKATVSPSAPAARRRSATGRRSSAN